MKLPIQDKKGFSLVEVMLAMVVLAIISIPLLNNFITSTKLNVKSKQLQDANVIGQEILEELRYMKMHEIYEQYNVAGEANLSVLDGAKNTISEGAAYLVSKQFYFRKQGISRDIGTYNVEVEVNSGTYDTIEDINGVAGATKDGPNINQMPIIKDISSSNNIVMSEPPVALSEAPIHTLLSTHQTACLANGKTSVSYDFIKTQVKRDIQIKIYDPDTTDHNVSATIKYIYYFDNPNPLNNIIYGIDNTMKPEAVVYDIHTLEKNNIENIYLFYNPLNDTGIHDTVLFDVESSLIVEPQKKISLYFIAQEKTPPLPVGAPTPQLTLGNPIPSIITKVFKNVTIGSLSASLAQTGLVQEIYNMQRLYEIKVRIYKSPGGVASYDADDLLAEFESTKGE